MKEDRMYFSFMSNREFRRTASSKDKRHKREEREEREERAERRMKKSLRDR